MGHPFDDCRVWERPVRAGQDRPDIGTTKHASSVALRRNVAGPLTRNGAGTRVNVIATGEGRASWRLPIEERTTSARPRSALTSHCPRNRFNPYTTPELTFRFHLRNSQDAVPRASALVVFPGGFGTMDEMFEILTLRQTGKAPKVPIVLSIATIGSARSIWKFFVTVA
jgi:predicted Rossmann-fold nucleotide-binding protein